MREPNTERAVALALIAQQQSQARHRLLPGAHPRRIPPDRVTAVEAVVYVVALLAGIGLSVIQPWSWF